MNTLNSIYKDIDEDTNILFFAETNNCSVMRTLIEGIKEFSDEMNIYLTEKSMKIIVNSKLDGSRIDCILNADKFSHYKLDLENMTSHGELKIDGDKKLLLKRVYIKTGPLQKLFKTVKSQNNIRFMIVKGDEMTFKIEFVNTQAKRCVRYSIRQLSTTDNKVNFLNKISYQHVISLTTSNLKEQVAHIKSVIGAKFVKIIYNGKMLIFTSKGDSSEIESVDEQIQNTHVSTDGVGIGGGSKIAPTLISPCSKNVELGCLNGIVKFSNISSTVEMHMDDKFPLLFSFSIADFGRLIVIPTHLIEKSK